MLASSASLEVVAFSAVGGALVLDADIVGNLVSVGTHGAFRFAESSSAFCALLVAELAVDLDAVIILRASDDIAESTRCALGPRTGIAIGVNRKLSI